MDDPLLRSLKDERVMLLAHRDRLREALSLIVVLVDEGEHELSAEEALMRIGNLAEAALKL